MMDTMRKAAKSWVAKLLIGLLAVSFGVWGIADVFRGGKTGSLASVGSEHISPQDYSRAFQDYIQNYSRQTGQGLTPEEARNMGIDRAILDNLIQTAAVDNEIAALKLGVSNDFLARDVMANAAFQDASGKFDANKFKQLLAQNGMNEHGFFNSERERMLRQALTVTASTGLPVNDGLVEARYRFENEQRDARYVVVTTQDSEVAAPTDEEIKKEYEADPAAFTAPEYRSIAVMKAEPADVAAKVSLTDQDIAQGYETYKGDYFTPERRTVLQISFPSLDEAKAARDKIAAGEDFLALARERGFSEQDVTFADKTKTDFIDPAIAGAAFALAEGAVSEPVKGALSTALIKAVKITPEHQQTLAEVRPQIEERLKLARAAEEIQAVYDAVEDARAAQTSFENIAAKAGIPYTLVPAVDAQGKDKDGKPVALPHPEELLKAAFGSDVGVENDAISLDNGYVWYEVREVVPSALRPLDVVKDQARTAVIAKKVQALSEEKAKKLVERARAGAKLEDIAAELKAEIKTAQGLKRTETGEGFPREAVAALFAAPENGFSYALEADGRSARVMQSEPVLLPAFDPASPEAKAIAEKLRPGETDGMLSAYVTALEDKAGVSVNETLWRNVSGQQTN